LDLCWQFNIAKKTSVVTINVSPQEKEKWMEFVKKVDMPMSVFARRAINVYISMLEKQWGNI
jgi:hypothetical protein